MTHDDVCIRRASTHEAKALVQPNGRVLSEYLEAYPHALSGGVLEDLTNKQRTDPAVLMLRQNEDTIEFDMVMVSRDFETADRLPVQLDNLMFGGNRLPRKAPALPFLIPWTIRCHDVRPEGAFEEFI
jgi:hypothetical protein